MRFLSAFFLALLMLASCGADPVEIICHRGLKASAPENTIPAIEMALAAGCDVVEVDVRVSRDGQVVLMHDASVSRTTNGTGKIEELDYDQHHSTPISSGTILMEGARMVDEWPIIERRIPSDRIVLRKTVAAEL